MPRSPRPTIFTHPVSGSGVTWTRVEHGDSEEQLLSVLPPPGYLDGDPGTLPTPEGDEANPFQPVSAMRSQRADRMRANRHVCRMHRECFASLVHDGQWVAPWYCPRCLQMYGHQAEARACHGRFYATPGEEEDLCP